jgi:undecaprenyl-diphosphatase
VNATFFICLIGFTVLSVTYNSFFVVQFDESIKQLVEYMETPALTHFFIFLTFFGSKTVLYFISLILLLVFIYQRQWAVMTVLAFNLFGVRYVNAKLKVFFARERPEWEHFVDVMGYSFPSGHTMNSSAFYGFLVILLLQTRIRYRTYIITAILCMIALIGISRIYLGVHYPTDVIGGLLAGTMWAVISFKMYHLLQYSTKT